MKTILEIVKLSTSYLEQRGFENPRRFAHEVISDALNVKPLELYLQFDRPLTDKELDICRANLQRRGKGEPAQYIRGFIEFYDCKILVNPSVLIPRPETEILVDMAAKDMANSELDGKILLDLCCGSGCIGISLKKKFPQLHVVLSDLSKDALEVARQNAKENEVEVEFVEGDLFEPFQGRQAHYIVCNPPYVSDEEYEELDSEVRAFEPRMALAAGEAGLYIYKRLATEINNYLYPHGKVWMEIGYDQGESIKDLFEGLICKKSSVAQDWSGHDRFFFLEIE